MSKLLIFQGFRIACGSLSDQAPRQAMQAIHSLVVRVCGCCLFLFLANSSLAQSSSTLNSSADGSSSDASATFALPEYALQPGDLLGVTVYQEDELNREVLVRPDGGISFPLAGDIRVAGLSAAAVKNVLEQRLDQYIPESNVTVAVLQISGNQVFVVGKVNRPGAYPLYRPLDVMQALALAGGAAQFADLDNIRILRRESSGRQQVFDFEYSDVIAGRRLEQNRVLVSGDTIVVP